MTENSLPVWLQIVGLIGGLLWPLSQLIKTIYGPKLAINMTRDLFFRFIDAGECLFLRPVLIAENGNVLIKAIHANLSLSSGNKNWDLEFLHFGDVVRNGSDVVSNFYFHSTSPIRFLSREQPIQAVYMARPKGYGTEFTNINKTYLENLTPLKAEASALAAQPDEAKSAAINKKLYELASEYSKKLNAKVQLEAGNYELRIHVEYRGVTGLNSLISRKTDSAILSFEIETNARDEITASLMPAVYSQGWNYIYNASLIINYPQYNPINVLERSI